MDGYVRRVVDAELDELLPGLPAISLEGPRGVGKTATAAQRAGTVYALDDPNTLDVVRADLGRLATGTPPILVDEWQRLPASWDVIRRAVDRGAPPGQFLLTGSATPVDPPTHSGAGRIVRLRVRPRTLPERGVETPTVSLQTLLAGAGAPLEGTTSVRLDDYVSEILTGGLPGMRSAFGRVQRAALDGDLDRIVEADIPELGVQIRRPATLRRWLAAYAAATASCASYERIRDAAASRDGAFLGALLESLATLSVRVFAQAAGARVLHLRTKGGEREVDLIVERDDGRIVAIEVKLSAAVDDEDLTHLTWLRGASARACSTPRS